jgi:hypothetical protein
MFKKIKAKIKELLLKRRQYLCAKEFRHKYRRKVAYDLLMHKCIEYISRLDANSNAVHLPACHKAEVVLGNILHSERDIFRYNRRFPFKLVHRELEAMEECYSY